MLEYETCKICGQNDWRVLATRRFTKKEPENLDDFAQKTNRFLFEIWFPGQTGLQFENLYCRSCGFVCFFPRPDTDVLNHFRWGHLDPGIGRLSKVNVAVERQRSQYLYEYLARHGYLNNIRRVLDYGGMDGKLMAAFLAAEKDCFLIDHCPVVVPGVTKLGDTVDDLQQNETFDLIICNHVIEHIAAPVETLRNLLSRLSQTGILFVEVPMELWKKPPLLKQHDPITHINFFSPNSLQNLLICSGADVLKCQLTESLHPTAAWYPAIRCTARLKNITESRRRLLKPDSLDFLNPGLNTYVRYYTANRRKLKSELLKRLAK